MFDYNIHYFLQKIDDPLVLEAFCLGLTPQVCEVLSNWHPSYHADSTRAPLTTKASKHLLRQSKSVQVTGFVAKSTSDPALILKVLRLERRTGVFESALSNKHLDHAGLALALKRSFAVKGLHQSISGSLSKALLRIAPFTLSSWRWVRESFPEDSEERKFCLKTYGDLPSAAPPEVLAEILEAGDYPYELFSMAFKLSDQLPEEVFFRVLRKSLMLAESGSLPGYIYGPGALAYPEIFKAAPDLIEKILESPTLVYHESILRNPACPQEVLLRVKEKIASLPPRSAHPEDLMALLVKRGVYSPSEIASFPLRRNETSLAFLEAEFGKSPALWSTLSVMDIGGRSLAEITAMAQALVR